MSFSTSLGMPISSRWGGGDLEHWPGLPVAGSGGATSSSPKGAVIGMGRHYGRRGL